jgi:hypothetical protein
VFQEAARAIHSKSGNIVNIDALDANLSITDIPGGLFAPRALPVPRPTPEEIKKYSTPTQTNVCQRQGRCVLVCLPGARHTLNKQIYGAMTTGRPLDVHPLCEVNNIEQIGRGGQSDLRDYGAFNSSTLFTAQAPWGWKDHNDGLERGVMFLDPAKLTYHYFGGFKEFDFKYKKVMQKSEQCLQYIVYSVCIVVSDNILLF